MVFELPRGVSFGVREGESHSNGVWSHWRGALATVLLVAAFAAVAWIVARTFDEEDLVAMVEHLRGYGRHWWAPAALIGAMIVVNLTGIPGTPLTLAAGIVWGWFGGGVWMMVATMIGTAFPWLLTRRGFPGLREKLERRFGRTFEWIQGSAFSSVTILRIVHVFPFAMVSYAAGLAGVRARDYFAGTFVGTAPGVFIYTYLADSIIRGMVSPDDAKQQIAVAATLLTVFVIVTNIAARRLRRRHQRLASD